MCWTPSFNVLPLKTISTFVVSRNYFPRRFLFVCDSITSLEVANKYIALIFVEKFFADLVCKRGGARPPNLQLSFWKNNIRKGRMGQGTPIIRNSFQIKNKVFLVNKQHFQPFEQFLTCLSLAAFILPYFAHHQYLYNSLLSPLEHVHLPVKIM